MGRLSRGQTGEKRHDAHLREGSRERPTWAGVPALPLVGVLALALLSAALDRARNEHLLQDARGNACHGHPRLSRMKPGKVTCTDGPG